MRRKLFTAALVASMLLCVATVVLWVRSYQKPTEVQKTTPDGLKSWSFTSLRGTIRYWVSSRPFVGQDPEGIYPKTKIQEWRLPGFSIATASDEVHRTHIDWKNSKSAIGNIGYTAERFVWIDWWLLLSLFVTPIVLRLAVAGGVYKKAERLSDSARTANTTSPATAAACARNVVRR